MHNLFMATIVAMRDEFLDSIKNGKWHSLTQLSRRLTLPLNQLVEISESLCEKGLIKYEKKAQWVKINPEWELFLSGEEEKVDHKPAVGTIIIPPRQSVRIQNVHITNITSLDIELWMKVCKKLTELAISKID